MGFKKIMAAALTSGMLLSFVPAAVMADSTGWKHDTYGWRYYVLNSGYVKEDWKQIDGKWYYFLDNSYMLCDIDNCLIDGVYYSFDETGACINPYESQKKLYGWHKRGFQSVDFVNGGMKYKTVWYYFDPDGTPAKGWRKIDDEWYYFDFYDSSMYCSSETSSFPRRIGDSIYFFAESGAMITGWYFDSKYWRYADSEGNLYMNKWLQSNGDWYYFDGNGRMAESENNIEINGVSYNFGEDGVCLNPYESSAVHKSGWCKSRDRFGSELWYYYDDDGSMHTGWLSYGGYWYYLIPENGSMVRGNYTVNGKNYFFNTETGELCYGWHVVGENEDASRFYYGYSDSDGFTYNTTWVYSGGNWYYIDVKGMAIVDSENLTINGIDYTFDQDGVCLNPDAEYKEITGWYWKSYFGSGDWYYFDENGNQYYNKWLNDGGNWYYLGYNGEMCHEDNVYINGLYYDFDDNGVCLNPYDGRESA